jgi:hypothetical protein
MRLTVCWEQQREVCVYQALCLSLWPAIALGMGGGRELCTCTPDGLDDAYGDIGCVSPTKSPIHLL